MELYSGSPGRLTTFAWLCIWTFTLGVLTAKADLSLQQAEAIALGNDPAVLSLQAEQSALEELSVVAGQLPDPVFRVGMMSLPVDTFDLAQEPMAQVVAGVVQTFPRGHTRALQQSQLQQRATAMDYAALDQELQVLLNVRQAYVDAVLQMRQRSLTLAAITVFADLVDITRDYYGTGRVQQQDVLQVAVELGRAEERSAMFLQEEREIRGRLSAWLGEAASATLPPEWPTLPATRAPEILQTGLPQHPRMRALQQQWIAAETGVDLANQRYSPEFALDVSYGARSGEEPSGMARPDLFSVMLVMDVPLFRDQRQDRVVAASVATSSAAAFQRDDVYRQMQSEAREQEAQLEQVRVRLEHFEKVLLPQANFSAEASFEAYRSSVGDLTSLLRARLTEYELGLEYAQLQAASLKAQARLLYLQGAPS